MRCYDEVMMTSDLLSVICDLMTTDLPVICGVMTSDLILLNP